MNGIMSLQAVVGQSVQFPGRSVLKQFNTFNAILPGDLLY